MFNKNKFLLFTVEFIFWTNILFQCDILKVTFYAWGILQTFFWNSQLEVL